ncbi:hypothetical protein PAXRUDRAFT_22866, partial [Paxillus rubicundulus Ve08.2h10]
MDLIPILIGGPTRGFDIIEPDRHPSTPGNPTPKSPQQLLRPLHLANEGLHEKAPEGYPRRACFPCHQAKVACNLSQPAKRPREQSRAPVQAPEPPKAPSPGPFKGPTCPSARATLKPLVTPSKWAPSLGPGPSPSKKAKASVSRSRLKTPSLTQKAKFTNDAGATLSSSIKVYHPLAGPPPHSIPQASGIKLIATPVNPILDPRPGPSSDPTDQIIKGLEVHVANLEKQVERIPNLELQLSSMAW